MELREVTNVVVPARSASLDKGPYTPGGRHFSSPGAEEATLRGAARMLLNLLTAHKEAVSQAEASGDLRAYTAACAAMDENLVLARHAVRAVAPKDASTQFPGNDALRLNLWAAVEHLEESVREGMNLPAGSPPRTPLALQRTRSDELATPLRRKAHGSAAAPKLAPPPETPPVTPAGTPAGDSAVVDPSDMTFGGFEVRTPMQTVLPWAQPQGGALDQDGASPLPAFPLLSPVAEAPPPAAEEIPQPVPPRRMPLFMRLLRAALLVGATAAVGLAAAPHIARHVQRLTCPTPAVPPLSEAAPTETAAAVVMEASGKCLRPARPRAVQACDNRQQSPPEAVSQRHCHACFSCLLIERPVLPRH